VKFEFGPMPVKFYGDPLNCAEVIREKQPTTNTKLRTGVELLYTSARFTTMP